MIGTPIITFIKGRRLINHVPGLACGSEMLGAVRSASKARRTRKLRRSVL